MLGTSNLLNQQGPVRPDTQMVCALYAENLNLTYRKIYGNGYSNVLDCVTRNLSDPNVCHVGVAGNSLFYQGKHCTHLSCESTPICFPTVLITIQITPSITRIGWFLDVRARTSNDGCILCKNTLQKPELSAHTSQAISDCCSTSSSHSILCSGFQDQVAPLTLWDMHEAVTSYPPWV